MSEPVLYLLNQPFFFFREGLYQSCLITYMQFPSVDQLMLRLIMVTILNLNILKKKENICAEFATTFQIRILKKQKNVDNPSAKQARLS